MANRSYNQGFFVFDDPKYFKSNPSHPGFLNQRIDTFYQKRVKESWRGGHILRGKQPNPEDVIVQSNDYLGIAKHPDIIHAQVKSLMQSGQGQMVSQVFRRDYENPKSGFDAELAAFLGVEDILTAQSGWCANTGLMNCIVERNTPVYIDRLAHMSLWEGITSAGGRPIPFKHNCPSSLNRQINKYGQGVIVTDSIFSTIGDASPLTGIVEIKRKHNCLLVVDESHSLGICGPQGRGYCHALGIMDDVDFLTASLAKAFCGRGGIITCSTRMKEYVLTTSLPTIFSTSVLAHDLAAFSASLEIIKAEQFRRDKLWQNANYLRQGLLALGYNLHNSTSPIISLHAGTEPNTIQLRDALEARGVFGSVYCHPATPKNHCLVRFSINATLTREDMDHIIQACKDVREEVNMWQWASTQQLKRAVNQDNMVEEVAVV